MPAKAQKQKDNSEVMKLRKEAGIWLKEMRETAGLSQRELAQKVGIDYYTFISQIEAGRGKVPTERYEAYAIALNIPAREFATTMLRYNDPHIYQMIFADQPQSKRDSKFDALSDRLSLLEAKLSL